MMASKMQVSDGDHIARLIACLFMAIPFFEVCAIVYLDGPLESIIDWSVELKYCFPCRGVHPMASFLIT